LDLSKDENSQVNARNSPVLSESGSREVVSLFRTLASTVAADSESRVFGHSDLSAALAESAQLLSTYFGNSRVGLCVLDTDYRYVAINQTLAGMNDIPAAEHLGRTVREVLGDFAEVIEPQFARVLATREPVLNIEISFVLHNSYEPGHWIEHYIPITDAAAKSGRLGLWR
jgi:PAS domain-containing protein